jgi:mannose-1-phosphate guanylyltransferase
MVSSGDHSWNSGIFFWKAENILAEFARQMPELHKVLVGVGKVWGTAAQDTSLAELWPTLRNETIDYGIMENAGKVAVLPAAGLEWSDLGNWNSLFDVLLPDKNGNIVFSGHHIPLETSSSLVYGNNDDRLIVTIGVDNMIIVDAGDVLLVCRKDRAMKVRQVVDSLKISDKKNFT